MFNGLKPDYLAEKMLMLGMERVCVHVQKYLVKAKYTW